MNPLPDSNQIFSHDAVKYVYQESDMRMVNPMMLTPKPFKVNTPDKSKKIKKDSTKKKSEGETKNLLSGLFGLF